MPKTPTTRARKPKALSLHIGINSVNPADYAGWDGPLAAWEFDAEDMAALAKSRGMKPTVLLTRKAKRKAVLTQLRKAAKALKAGLHLIKRLSRHQGTFLRSTKLQIDQV